ncbi:MAG: AMP-binding protein [Burkholderiales bacterium]|nr:AMP-binding protein [Burkholderiales bacterium]
MPSTTRSIEIDRYQALYNEFAWLVPPNFNIADVCCNRWANDPARIAMHYEDEAGNTGTLTYGDLQMAVNRLSNVLQKRGVLRGDRIAIILPQRPETAIAHMACHQLGAVAMPMSTLFGPEAIEYRLQDSGAVAAIVDQASVGNVLPVRANCPSLQHIIAVESHCDETLDWHAELANASASFTPMPTKATDPAILIYTSGTTGLPKGALLPQQVLIGNLPGFVASQNWFPQAGDMFWSPADWAWTGGLMDALLPTLYFGMPIVAYRGRFSPETAFYLLEKYRVTNTFLFPTALKMMMKAVPKPRDKYNLKLRAMMSGGEAVGDAVFAWCQAELGITVNEIFGQTEANYLIGGSADLWPAKPGSMGRPYPGHQVTLLDDEGKLVVPGEIGEIALNRFDIHGYPDPILFLGYWNNPEATKKKFAGDWCRTGDLAAMDEDGYLWYQGRADDVFKAAGYRIGPAEIENCLVKHPAVLNAAAVPKPDADRGNIVKAYVVLTPGTPRSSTADAQLVADLQAHVRGKLAPYEYPKEIEFIDALPMTTTGKVQRRILRLQEEERAKSISAGTARD